MENQMVVWIAIVGIVAVAFLIRVVQVFWVLKHGDSHDFIRMCGDAELFGMSVGDDDDE